MKKDPLGANHHQPFGIFICIHNPSIFTHDSQVFLFSFFFFVFYMLYVDLYLGIAYKFQDLKTGVISRTCNEGGSLDVRS